MGTRKSNRKSTKYKKRFRQTRSKRGGGQLLSHPSPPHICPICTEDINDNCIITSCGHHFDKDCLKEWCNARRGSPTCPICRAPIDRICRELLFTLLEKLLFDAIKVGEIDFAERALSLGFNDDGSIKYDHNNIPLLNIDVMDKNGNTPLIIAARNNEDEIVDLLLRQGATMEHLNDDNKNAYQIAIENGSTNVENKLLEYGYYDPLDDAIEFLSRQHNTGASHGGKRRTSSKKQRGGSITDVLLDAAMNGDLTKVEYALNNGADVNARDENNMTALIHASVSGHTDIMTKLLNNGADVNAKDDDGWTSLMLASMYGDIEIVNILLEEGADVNIKDNDGETAIDWATENENTEIIKILKQYIVAPIIPKTVQRQEERKAFAKQVNAPREIINDGVEYLGGKRKTRSSKKSKRKVKSHKEMKKR